MKSCYILLLFLSLVLLPGCNTSSAPEERDVTLTFDAKTCEYQGPARITPGDVTITMVNDSSYDASIWIVRIEEGKTWQDMLDYFGVPGAHVEPPEWSSSNLITSFDPGTPHIRKYSLAQGLYAICCCTCSEIDGPRGVWPGSQLEVIAENSSD